MQSPTEILPAEIENFSLPPGLELPANVVLTECEAARFLREPEARLRMRRFNGTGPAFIKIEGDPASARYLVWDCLAWLCRHRRTVMPERECVSASNHAPGRSLANQLLKHENTHFGWGHDRRRS